MKKKLNALIVEDESEMIEIYKQAFRPLEDENVGIFYASSLVECLRCMDERIFEIFVIDLKINREEKGMDVSENYRTKAKRLINEVDEVLPTFDRQKFLYSYCLIREIINSLPYYKMLVISQYLGDTDEEELKTISEGHILKNDIKSKDETDLAREIRSLNKYFKNVLNSFTSSDPIISPDIREEDYFLVKHSLKDFTCDQFTISQIHKGRSGTRLFHVKEQHEDYIREVPEYLVKIGSNGIIKKEWDNCSKILGIGKIYPNQSFVPASQEKLISIWNCSCIIYPYEIGFSTFKDFYQQMKVLSTEEQTRLLRVSTQRILEKLRMLHRRTREQEQTKSIKTILKIDIKVLEDARNNPDATSLATTEVDKLKEIIDFYKKIQRKRRNVVLSPVHGDFHSENILVNMKSIYKSEDNIELENIKIIDFQSFKEKEHYLIDYVRLESDIKFNLLPIFIDTETLKMLDKILIGRLPEDVLLQNQKNNPELSGDDLTKAITCIRTIRDYVNNEFKDQPEMELQYLLLLFLTSLKYVYFSLKYLKIKNEIVANFKYALYSASYIANKLKDAI